MRNHAVATRALRRTFARRRGMIDAVAGLDLEVEEGEIFGLLGPNGAGKTTTLRMLATLLAPTAGEAAVAGYDLRREPRRVRQQIGYVGQLGGANSSATGRAELEFQGRLYGLSRAAARQRAGEVLTTLGLAGCGDRPAETLSGGQRRRLDVGLGLVHQPRLLFLDEPTTGLDPQSRASLWDEIRRLRDGGTTVFLTTHYMDEANALCDRVAIMDGGRTVAEGTPEALKREIGGDVVVIGVSFDAAAAGRLLAAQPFVREVDLTSATGGQIRLGVDSGETALPAILRLLDATGFTLETISLCRPSMDDVFLRRTGRSLLEARA